MIDRGLHGDSPLPIIILDLRVPTPHAPVRLFPTQSTQGEIRLQELNRNNLVKLHDFVRLRIKFYFNLLSVVVMVNPIIYNTNFEIAQIRASTM